MYEVDWIATSRSVSTEVPQRSVLGLTIWNLFYNELLRVALPEVLELIAYEDYIAIVTRAAVTNMVGGLLEEVTEKVVIG